jgi:hypothetical protein
MAVTSKGVDRIQGAHVEGALRGHGTKTVFAISKPTENTARLGIRVGTFGDEVITSDLHNEVGRELAALR